MMLFLKHSALSAIVCAAALAQTFEVASVKPSSAPGGRPSVRAGAEQISYANVTLASVVLRAYGVKSFQLSGPDWISSQRYDIVAKIPSGTSPEQGNLMLQNLLAARFHLALHRETKELQGYELTIGKTAPKLKPSTEDGPDVQPMQAPKRDANGFPQLTAPGLVLMEGVRGTSVVSFLTARAQPLSALVEMISKDFRLPVIDGTGMAGKFDFNLEFGPQAPGAVTPDTADDSAAANLVNAIPRQLGLRLASKKIPTDILVIDRADKIPTEN
jgi:uncharacterized protein (TIGR03435 family)